MPNKETIHLKDKSIVLPQIELKYFGPDEDGKKPFETDLECVKCHKKGITIGSAQNGKTGDLEYICEDCSIEDFKKINEFSSLEAAAAYRRRMFDVSYLFLEKLIEAYLDKFKTDLDSVDEDVVDTIVTIGRSLYDELPKAELEKIMYLEDLEELNANLNSLIEKQDILEQFFEAFESDQKTMEMVDRILAKLDDEEKAFFMAIFASAYEDELGDELEEFIEE
jgi:hypothetical protein